MQNYRTKKELYCIWLEMAKSLFTAITNEDFVSTETMVLLQEARNNVDSIKESLEEDVKRKEG